MGILFHSGRTDNNSGHNDHKNISGVGYYHYHYGNGPEKYDSNYEKASLIDELELYKVIFSVGSDISGKLVFEATKLLEDKKYFKLQISGKETDGFYLEDAEGKNKKENFLGTELNPKYVTRKNSPWIGKLGGLDYIINKKYFRDLMIKHFDLDDVYVRFKNDWSIANVSFDFLKEVVKVSDDLNIDPDDLMKVMLFETNGSFSASYKNPGSSASGLIGFMYETAIGLGTSTEELRKMTNIEQLEYVKKYLMWYPKIKTLGDIYMAILWPAGIGKSDDYIVFQEGDRYYADNKFLDVNNDKKVTKKETLEQVINENKKFFENKGQEFHV